MSMIKKIGETSYKETAFGIIPRSELIELEVEGVKQIWDDLMSRSFPVRITVPFLLHLHTVGFQWIFPAFGGRLRTIDVRVSLHSPPKFFVVSQLLEEYCRDIDVRMKNLPSFASKDGIASLVAFLTWAHHRFVWIHPFQDYNGRLARILVNVLLLNLQLPPLELAVETSLGRKKYVRALAMADRGDFTLLEKLFHRSLVETAKKIGP